MIKIARLQKVKAKSLKVDDNLVLQWGEGIQKYGASKVFRLTPAREKYLKGDKQKPGNLMTVWIHVVDEQRRFRVLPDADLFIEPR